MNLEALEQACLKYLQQTKNPLVPVRTLLNHVQLKPQCREVSEPELLAFLRKHELFKVVDAPSERDPEEEAELESLGLVTGPRVILVTRVPTPTEIAAIITEQMSSMTDALYRALAEATETGDVEACNQINEVLQRAAQLQKKIGDIL